MVYQVANNFAQKKKKKKEDKNIRQKYQGVQDKTKITGITLADNNRLDTEVVITLKYLHNVWGSLDLPLINCD